MIALEQLNRFVQAASDASDVAALRDLVSNEIIVIGFDRFSYVALQRPSGKPGRIYIGTYPADWSRYYTDFGLWLHDPVMQHPFQAVQPFLWDQIARAQATERLVFGPAADAGLSAGAAVPIHGPYGGVALLAVSKDCSEREFHDIFAEQRYPLQILAYAAHDAVLRLTDVLQAEQPIQLSPRQREVLLWTIHGKTNWEIGEILNIAEDTVRQHLRAICRLLGANNRAQAAAIAVNRNIISPGWGAERTIYLP